MNFYNIKVCRVCKSNDLKQVFSIQKTALTGVFLNSPTQYQDFGPMTLLRCMGACGLVQLRETYDQTLMYGSTYGYRSGLNVEMALHLKSKIQRIESTVNLQAGDTIVDIGSNDGTSLKQYSIANLNKIGVDPSAEKFKEYYSPDTLLIVNYFDHQTLSKFVGMEGAKVITSFSMFYDLPDPIAFAKDIAKTLHPNGIWVFEQSYLKTMLDKNAFDTVCHEHLEYYSFTTINYILSSAGLKAIDIEFNEINGGSISITACHKSCVEHSVASNVIELLKIEKNDDELALIETMVIRVKKEKMKLLKVIYDFKAKEKKIFCLGASTKGNTLLQYYGLTVEDICAVGEVNPDKFGKFTPGSLIPIVNEDEILVPENKDALFIVLPWHFKKTFESNPKYKKFQILFPLPNVAMSLA
jgi:NDP-4-keto-2,6-dideoxyhexose 3-C-methyltransferase